MLKYVILIKINFLYYFNIFQNYLKAFLKPKDALCHIYDLDSSHETIIIGSIEKVESLTGAYIKSSESCLFIYGVNNCIISDAVACFDEIITNIKNLNFFPNELKNKQINKSHVVQPSSSNESQMSVDFHEEHPEMFSKLSDSSCYIVASEELDCFNNLQENSVELMDVDYPAESKEVSIISIHSSENEEPKQEQTKTKKKKKRKKPKNKTEANISVNTDLTSPNMKHSTPKVQNSRCKSASPYIPDKLLTQPQLLQNKPQPAPETHIAITSNNLIIPPPPVPFISNRSTICQNAAQNVNMAARPYFQVTRNINQIVINNYKMDNQQNITNTLCHNINNNHLYNLSTQPNTTSYDVRQHQSFIPITPKPSARSSSNSPPIISKHQKLPPSAYNPPKPFLNLPTTTTSPCNTPPTTADSYKSPPMPSHTSRSSNRESYDIRSQQRSIEGSPPINYNTTNHHQPSTELPLLSPGLNRLPKQPPPYELGDDVERAFAPCASSHLLRDIVVDGSNVAMKYVCLCCNIQLLSKTLLSLTFIISKLKHKQSHAHISNLTHIKITSRTYKQPHAHINNLTHI